MKWLIKLFKIGFWMALIGCTVGAIAAISLYFYLEPDLPSTENLKNVRFQVPLRVYSADGKLMAEFGEKRRIPLTYSEIPQPMTDAFLAAEDDRFFEHPGVDYQGLIRAAVQLALTGERRQGGSTITMQVARNFYLSSEKTYTRKLNEILLALQIERELTKHEILELYLNKIYLGHRAYGVGAAAQVYYGKRVDELNLAQTAMIAGLPKAPSRFNPVTNPDRALLRR
ncbi:MAG: transglycosylase domain-containing protein, partial [Sedimenticola sp.]